MGANMLNTILEGITAYLKNELKDVDILMSILSNHATASVVKVQGEITVDALSKGDRDGEAVAKRMERASVLAQVDIHRAATHNKGVMNGIHAVVLATGNDTRGAEATAHAYASKDGQYRGLATWKYDEERQTLVGTVEVPMTLATVGGGTKVLPIAKGSFKLEKFVTVDNKFLTRLISFTSVPGLMNLIRNNKDISFTKMVGEFSYKDDIVQIFNGKAEGPYMDLTMKGTVNTKKHKMQISGNVSPSKYGPGIVTKIPIIGNVFKITPYSISDSY